MAKLKIGIIGCGGIANIKHLPALSTFKDEVELTYFCDIIIERAEAAAKHMGLQMRKYVQIIMNLLQMKVWM